MPFVQHVFVVEDCQLGANNKMVTTTKQNKRSWLDSLLVGNPAGGWYSCHSTKRQLILQQRFGRGSFWKEVFLNVSFIITACCAGFSKSTGKTSLSVHIATKQACVSEKMRNDCYMATLGASLSCHSNSTRRVDSHATLELKKIWLRCFTHLEMPL